MSDSGKKTSAPASGSPSPIGNQAERWQKLLDLLDEKLQLGLLEKLKGVSAYHFEGDALFIEVSERSDAEYLQKQAVSQQLAVFAQEAVKVKTVKISIVSS